MRKMEMAWIPELGKEDTRMRWTHSMIQLNSLLADDSGKFLQSNFNQAYHKLFQKSTFMAMKPFFLCMV